MVTGAVLAALAVLAFGVRAAGVDANTATRAELEQIAGIGPSVAARILDARSERPFADWSDLIARVRGVGEGSATKFSAAGLTVNGAGFRAAVPAPKR